MPSVFPEWMANIPMQQQSVLVLAARGPDGIRKHHPCKDVVRAYRACVLKAAYYGRELRVGEKADSFMCMERFTSDHLWALAVKEFFDTIDELPHHYLLHLAHGAQILGIHHPDEFIRDRWRRFYLIFCNDAHMMPELDEVMSVRLGDWGRQHWDNVDA